MKAKELFQALEFAHYAERFRNKLFVIAFAGGVSFQELLLDIKVLTSYHIKVALVVPDPEFRLQEIVATSNKRGTRFHLTLVTEAVYPHEGGEFPIDLARMNRVLGAGGTVLIAHHAGAGDLGGVPPSYALAGDLAEWLQAEKLFLVGNTAAHWESTLKRTHVTVEDFPAVREQLQATPGSPAAWLLDYIAGRLEAGLPDVVMLDDRSTFLFREVFTHDGAGILFNSVRRAQVRRAQVADTTDVALLLRPEIEAGRILPVDENTIEREIGDFWIYEVDHLLVGVARLKRYGTWAELAHFSTLPRYRGKGRARELAVSMIQQAEAMESEAVFALSVDPRMWDFFQSLGFHETPRESLPGPWQAQYDFSRPSHAFLRELR